MADQKSDDWLPEGWKVEVKVRKNGRKDKFYLSPSGELKFHSKLEVSQYISSSKHKLEKKDDDKQKNVEPAHCHKKVVFEKAIPDGLPPGWTKEIKITKKAGRIRRDPYYTDPVSGYVFRSMKDALRYVETGELGRLALKTKAKEDNSMEVEDDEACVGASLMTPTVTKKQKLENEETKSSTINEKSSKFCGILKDEVICDSTSPKDSIPVTGQTAEQSGLGPGLRSLDLQMAGNVSPSNGKGDFSKLEFSVIPAGLVPQLTSSDRPVHKVVNQSNGKRDSSKSESSVVDTGLGPQLSSSDLPTSNGADHSNVKSDSLNCELSVTLAVEVRPYKELLENGLALEEAKSTGPRKSMKKKDLNTPRRASKRLAGVPLDPTPELKTTTHGCRTVAGQSEEMAPADLEGSSSCHPASEPEVTGTFNRVKNHGMPAEADKHLIGKVGASSELAEKVVTVSAGGEKHECAVVPPVAAQDSTEEHVRRVQTNNNIIQKPELPLDLPLGEFWQDPCIAFAIQTLTGTNFESSDSIKVSQELNNGECEDLATVDQARVGKGQNQYAADLPLHRVAVPELRMGDVGMVSKADVKPASPLGFPAADAWADPCIEFAIKTH